MFDCHIIINCVAILENFLRIWGKFVFSYFRFFMFSINMTNMKIGIWLKFMLRFISKALKWYFVNYFLPFIKRIKRLAFESRLNKKNYLSVVKLINVYKLFYYCAIIKISMCKHAVILIIVYQFRIPLKF